MAAHPDHAHHRTAAVVQAIDAMKAGLGRPLSLADIARAGMFSPFYFHRIFREITAVTPARFLAALRMAEARRLLMHSAMTVAEISWRVGYESLGTFTTQFGRLVGVPPGRFRQLMRSLRAEPVDAVLPLLDTFGTSSRGPVLALSGVPPQRGLVVGGLCPTGSLRERHGAWTVATGTPRVRLPDPGPPGEYAAFSVVVPAETRLVDALVDDVPGSYLLGAARIRLSRGPAPATVPVTLRHPRPTDPPVLAVAPLRWLAMSRPPAEAAC